MSSTRKCKVCPTSFEPKSASHVTCSTKCHHAYYTDAKIEEIYMAWNNAGRHEGLAGLRRKHGPVFSRRLNYNIARLDEKINYNKPGPKPKKVVAAPKPAPQRVEVPLEDPLSVLSRMDDTTLQLYAELRKTLSVAREILKVTKGDIEALYATIQAKTAQKEHTQREIAEFEADMRELVKGL